MCAHGRSMWRALFCIFVLQFSKCHIRLHCSSLSRPTSHKGRPHSPSTTIPATRLVGGPCPGYTRGAVQLRDVSECETSRLQNPFQLPSALVQSGGPLLRHQKGTCMIKPMSHNSVWKASVGAAETPSPLHALPCDERLAHSRVLARVLVCCSCRCQRL